LLNKVPHHEDVLREWRYSSTLSLLLHITHGVTAPGTHWIEGWVGTGAGPDAVVKRTNPIVALSGIEHQSSSP